VCLVTEHRGPHASRVVRAVSALTPRTGFSPALRHHGLLQQKACPCRPRSGAIPSDRTFGLSPREVRGLCPNEPPSNRTSTSPCIRLYGQTPRNWRLMRPPPTGG